MKTITMRHESTGTHEFAMVGNRVSASEIREDGRITDMRDGKVTRVREVGPIDLAAVQKARAAAGWTLVS